MTQRLHFKKEMAEAIIAGKKIATTRDHAKALGPAIAVRGSRYKPIPFAEIEIESIVRMPLRAIVAMYYDDEGFDSPAAMWEYLTGNDLMKDEDGIYFKHQFKVVRFL